MATTDVGKSPKLLDRVRLKLRLKQYAWTTEKAYVSWVEKFMRFHKGRNNGRWKPPTEMGKAEVEEYLSWLAADQNIGSAGASPSLSRDPRSLQFSLRLRAVATPR